jgi:membrane protein
VSERFISALRRTWQRTPTVFLRAASGHVRDYCPQMAAGISYWVFFSIFPLAIVLVAIAGRLLRDEELQTRLINNMIEFLPLEPVEGRRIIEDVIGGLSSNLDVFAIFSIVGLIWGASAMMTSIRLSINIAWGHGVRRPALLGKLVDIAMVFSFGLLVLVSIVVTGLLRVGAGIIDSLPGSIPDWTWIAVSVGTPFLISIVLFSLLYRFVVTIPVAFVDIWPGVLFAAFSFEVLKQGFAFYLTNFSNLNAVYGSIGAIVAFMMFVYFSANIMLFGAELASEWQLVRSGYYDDHALEMAAEDERSTWEKLRNLVLGLVLQNPDSYFGEKQPTEPEDQDTSGEVEAISSTRLPKGSRNSNRS